MLGVKAVYAQPAKKNTKQQGGKPIFSFRVGHGGAYNTF
jgi:hypothetical protein